VRVISAVAAPALGQRRGRPPGCQPRLPCQGLQRTDTPFQRFVEASPHFSRATARCDPTTLLPASPLAPARNAQHRRRRLGALGLPVVQHPGHNPASTRAPPRAAFPLQRRQPLGRERVVEPLLPQTSPRGERTGARRDQGLSRGGSQDLGWRMMDQRGAPGKGHAGGEAPPPSHERWPLATHDAFSS
jgi:hypothetical protein